MWCSHNFSGKSIPRQSNVLSPVQGIINMYDQKFLSIRFHGCSSECNVGFGVEQRRLFRIIQRFDEYYICHFQGECVVTGLLWKPCTLQVVGIEQSNSTHNLLLALYKSYNDCNFLWSFQAVWCKCWISVLTPRSAEICCWGANCKVNICFHSNTCGCKSHDYLPQTASLGVRWNAITKRM